MAQGSPVLDYIVRKFLDELAATRLSIDKGDGA